MNYKNRLVISVGGSLIHPRGGISVEFLKQLNAFVRLQLKKDKFLQVFLVIGGGFAAVNHGNLGQNLGRSLTYADYDWLGIHATRLNAHLVRTIFRDIAHPYVLKHYEIIRKVDEQVVVAAGWKPDISTDYCAAVVCEDYKISSLINMTSIGAVYSKDPHTYINAKSINRMTWDEYRNLMKDALTPRMRMPFDIAAAVKAEDLRLKVVVLKGDDFKNIKNYLDGKDFVGTVIEG